ncbi:MAG: hypothetical protein HEQ19_21350 [Gloeotrichia echinulata CP02]|jgi:hypothetical protein
MIFQLKIKGWSGISTPGMEHSGVLFWSFVIGHLSFVIGHLSFVICH